MKIDKGILFRTIISIVLGLGGVAFFLAHQYGVGPMGKQVAASEGSPRRQQASADWREQLPAMDAEIDTAIVHSGIQKWWVKKKLFPVTDANFSRVERRIEVPRELLIIEMNTSLNELAHRYNGRAIASENLREHLVTVHVDIAGFVVQTIIFHTTDALPVQPVDKKEKVAIKNA